jgi:hyperosmotically inducible periplasmic protein
MTTLPSRTDPVRAPRGVVRLARRVACAAIGFTMLLALTGHGVAQELPPNKNVLDSRLTVQVATALWSDLRFPGKQISVDTQDGVVTLRGKVDSEEAKKAADDIIGRLEGVKKVRNELQVVPPDRRAEVDATDQAITRALDTRFKQDPQLQNAVIDTRVDAGVVTLRGQVRGNAASSHAVALARAVPGVRRVKNELTSTPLDRSG